MSRSGKSGGGPPDARLAAVQAITAVLDRQQSLAEEGAFPGGLSARDEAFARHLAYGVLRHFGSLTWLSNQLLSKPMRERDQDVQRLILVGLFQLWQSDTPGHAAVHACAEGARGLRKTWAVGVINAVLRRFQREQGQLLEELAAQDARFSHPQWLLEQLQADWPQQWPEIVAANNQQAPLWLRCNSARASVDSLQARFVEAGLAVQTLAQVPGAMAITPAVPVSQLPGFADGLCSVQDPAAQLAALLMDLQPGQRVLDACAAPGGKTCHMLELQPGIELQALDLVASRLAMVKANLERLGLGAQLHCADAAEVDSWWDGQPFDRILLDAPCSATGVIRRHPEIKWLRDPAQVSRAVATQKRLLERLWPLLKPGGILVYATCSVLHLENSQQIQQFLQHHPQALCLEPTLVPGLAQPCGRQLLPGQHDMDGFYYAVLGKPA
jgi:16S rRNA (cytosine967-C5)-methyltransferase